MQAGLLTSAPRHATPVPLVGRICAAHQRAGRAANSHDLLRIVQPSLFESLTEPRTSSRLEPISSVCRCWTDQNCVTALQHDCCEPRQPRPGLGLGLGLHLTIISERTVPQMKLARIPSGTALRGVSCPSHPRRAVEPVRPGRRGEARRRRWRGAQRGETRGQHGTPTPPHQAVQGPETP